MRWHSSRSPRNDTALRERHRESGEQSLPAFSKRALKPPVWDLEAVTLEATVRELQVAGDRCGGWVRRPRARTDLCVLPRTARRTRTARYSCSMARRRWVLRDATWSRAALTEADALPCRAFQPTRCGSVQWMPGSSSFLRARYLGWYLGYQMSMPTQSGVPPIFATAGPRHSAHI